MKEHPCLQRVDEKLAEHNTRLARNLLNRNQIFVETERIEKRRGSRAKVMIATFCPFCGKKLP